MEGRRFLTGARSRPRRQFCLWIPPLKSLESSLLYRTPSRSPSAGAGSRGSLSERCCHWPAFALLASLSLLVTCEGGVRLGLLQVSSWEVADAFDRRGDFWTGGWRGRYLFFFLFCLESRHTAIVREYVLPWRSSNLWTDAETKKPQLGLGLAD